ncbi:hypothetical protein BKA70DRAFT_1119370 [Coprinopsis sp. MPI-PUGE-AT-0042]|nr:hypothetical protein BKA70DRAFT_1119370 [Coprinopsis sp. MPI-PUGE-AT-0042]
MWGSSTFNTRIERMWLEVGKQFARAWRAFFYRLEERHLLDRSNRAHLWLLHYLFLKEINQDCKSFQATWNAHPISGGGHGLSPDDMRLLGQVEHGVYAGQPATAQTDQDIQVDNDVTMEDSEGVGGMDWDSDIEMHDADADVDMDHDSNWQDEENMSGFNSLTQNQELNIRHEPVPTPKSASPFRTQQEMTVFELALSEMNTAGKVPWGYGVLDDEWDEFGGEYLPYHHIPTRHRGKELKVDLPHDIWYIRAVYWAQALFTMNGVVSLRASA